MAASPAVNIKIGGSTAGYKRALDKAERQTKQFKGKTGKVLKGIGTAAVAGAGVAGVALAGLATAGLKSFAELDTGVREIATLIPDSTEEGIKEIRQQVQGLSTEFGVAGTEVAKSYYDSLSAGIAQEDAGQFLKDAGKLAVAGVTDMGSATDLLTSAINAFGMEASDAARISDIMFGTVKAGKTTINEIAGSFSDVGPVAASLGVSMEDTMAWMAKLTLSGTPTTQATTQIKAALSELGKEGTKSANIFEEYSGKTFRDFIAEGGNLEQAMAVMTEAAHDQGLSMLDMFGSVRAGQGALAITGQEIDAFGDIVEGLQDSTGATDEAFGVMSEGVEFKMKQLKEAFNGFKEGVGEAVLPIAEALLPVLQQLAEQLGPILTPLFETLGPIIEGLIEPVMAVVQVLADVLQPVLSGAGQVIEALSPIITKLAGILSEILPPVIEALMPIITGLADRFGDFIVKLLDGLMPVIDALIPIITELAGMFADILFDALDVLLPVIVELIDKIGPVLTEVIQKVMPIIMQLVDQLMETLMPILVRVLDAIMPIIDALLGVGLQILDSLMPIIEMLLPVIIELVEMGLDVLVEVIEQLAPVITDLVELLGDIVAQVVEWLQPVIEWLAEFLSDVLKKAFEGISTAVEVVIGWIKSAVDWFKELWDKVKAMKWGEVWDQLKDTFKAAINAVIRIWNSLDFSLGPYSIPDWIPGIGGKSFGIADIFPDIPMLAEGGIVTEPTLAGIGEAGPEVVFPLEDLDKYLGPQRAQTVVENYEIHLHVKQATGYKDLDKMARDMEKAVIRRRRVEPNFRIN